MNGESSYHRFLEGDEKAFEDIVKEYRSGLECFINSYVKNIYEAEDIAIDTFVWILEHKERYNFKTSLKTWLYTIARSRAIDFIRRQKRFSFHNVDDCDEATLNNDTKSLLDEITADETKRELHAAISELPQDMKEAIYLIYFEDLSYADAAKILHVNKKKIDNLVTRARVKLKDVLRKEQM